MTEVKCVVFLVVLTFLWTLNRGDAEVCVLMESCILPCSFQPGDEVVIHWIQEITGKPTAHSYYHNQDQLARQDQRFRGRTSLFKDQIFKGNASLRLTGVKVQDQGKYKCYTSTITGNKESFIILNVEAPVRKVDIQQVENRITCSSEGIYPKPELTWSTSPPSTPTPQSKTTVQQTELQLYNINSSLTLSASVADLDYSCTVSSGRSRRRATLFKPTSINVSDTETTIPCTSSNTPLTGLTWRFNHSQIILNQAGADVSHTVSEEWRQRVKSVSESGSLTLQDLSSNQEGIYTCELSNAEETHVTNTFLRIEKRQDTSTNIGGIAAGVVVAILVVILAALAVLYYRHKIPICKKFKKEQGTRDKKDIGQTNDEEHEKGKMLSNSSSTQSSGETKEMQPYSEERDSTT